MIRLLLVGNFVSKKSDMVGNFIYAFRDNGYERGVKIGRGASSNLTTAQCFTPRGVAFLGAWEVGLHQKVTVVEAAALKRLDSRRFVLPGFSIENTRTGREWFDLTPPEAVELISEALSLSPCPEPWRVRATPADEYQSIDRKPGRMMVFVQEECETRRLKVNSVSEWTSPRERQRRYSRNGFGQIAAYTYLDPEVTIDQNFKVVEARLALFRRYACNPKSSLGWLPEAAAREEVSHFLSGAGLTKISDIISSAGRPPGVRVAYNKGTDEKYEMGIPREELAHFPSPWWKSRSPHAPGA